MIMLSLLTWIIGVGVLVALSTVLRYLANEAHELARSRYQEAVVAEQKAQALRGMQPARSDESFANGRESEPAGTTPPEAMLPLAELETSATDSTFHCFPPIPR
jgi:hypothetical protein